MFFLTPNKNMFTGKLLVNSERFLAVLSKRIIFSVKWVEIHKMSEVFERNCIVKWKIFFGSFCWLWDFLLKNLKLKKISDDVHWTLWMNIKIQKNNFKYEFLNHLYFGPNFVFWETALGRFNQRFFFFFSIFQSWPAMAVDIFTQPAIIKKLPTTLEGVCFAFLKFSNNCFV